MSFRVVPIPDRVAEEARRTRRSPGFGHPVQVEVAPAGGYGPCRSCLHRTETGERRLLLTYNPCPGPEQVPIAGPIYLHEAACEPFRGPGFPEPLRGLPLVLQGHLADGSALLNTRLGDQDPGAAIEALLEDPRIAFLSIRNLEAGCFIARAERA